MDWTEEDPGYCEKCGTNWELVRPGKSQPCCDCHLICGCGNRYEYFSEYNPNPEDPYHCGEYCRKCHSEFLEDMK